MNSIKIGVAEDQQVFRSGLITLLKDLPHVNVIYEVENWDELILAIEIKGVIPNLLILNHNMPEIDGIKATKEAKEKFPLAKIILLSSEINDKNILDAIENGACVYLSKDELKILKLISQEFTTQQIADHIYKSSRTVEKYRTKMFLKVNVQSSVGLIIYAIKNNLIEI